MDSPLVATDWLAGHLGEAGLVVADVRWTIGQPAAGREAYAQAHLPGAVFLDLDTELSDLSKPRQGRHPLPEPDDLAAALARAGIGRGTRVVAYDDQGGSTAVRLWWLLRWLDAEASGTRCAILDGGITKWVAEGRPVEGAAAPGTAVPGARPALRRPHPAPLPAVTRPELTVDASLVARAGEAGLVLLDARAPERYRGEAEPIDARAGHIPGAVSAWWGENVTAGETPVFKSPAELRARFAALGVTDGSRAISYCGSGVTGAHNLLALELAGLRGARLYPGSWSGWVALHPDAGSPPPAPASA